MGESGCRRGSRGGMCASDHGGNWWRNAKYANSQVAALVVVSSVAFSPGDGYAWFD
ncbi:hypothetical protein M413DRAFT_448105 [Hebeloma cylindrosporum]|uniref:Uncharacterized protein n=1 Tax=Hebeloma cylindrosporum TaxID=76867 RepID=A0A0C2XK36_HEBCY|nr:hypothetical protein M413DRAFT_448105 [Hebeloma cylindrosporum h7]